MAKKKPESNNFRVKKYFGQNFLSDSFVISKIISSANISKDTVVLEIGPGKGALTKGLLKVSKKVIAYEVDNEVIPILKENTKPYTNLEIINEDILKTDLTYLNDYSEEVITVSNLPYYITSPIIDLFFKKLTKLNKAIFMVQKEVADRLNAKVGTKDYNAFTILVQYKSTVKKLIDVDRTSFKPAPNVDSAVIEIVKIERELKANNDKFFERVVKSSFSERRKTLVNNLTRDLKISKDCVVSVLDDLSLRADIRAENLSIDDFINLTNKLEVNYEH